MSSFEEDFSENSFEGSGSSSMRDEPPTLDEVIFNMNLFTLFLGYMKSQQAMGDLMFLKDARKFRMLNQPRPILIRQASKLAMHFVSPGAPYPTSISEDSRKKITEFVFDPVAELSLDKDSFSVAFGEVYNAVVPHFRNWISTGEWRDAIPFHRIPPPAFNVVLGSSSLRVLFNKYLKSLADHDTDGTAARAFQLWKFCLVVNDFREGKYNSDPHLDSKKKKKKEGESEEPEKEEEKKSPEEYAKSIYKKYKHQISLPYDKSLPHAVFIVRALDNTIEEFDKSSIFVKWIGMKQYLGVDYQAKVVHQSHTKEGFAEPPTLAAALTSSILPDFMALLQGTEQGLNIEFLSNVLMFQRKYISLDPDSPVSSSVSSTGSMTNSLSGSSLSGSGGRSHKEMVEDAKRIFNKFIDKSEMYCDPGLVEEVRTLINKNNGKGCNPRMFRKIGTFIYQRSELTWCREARAACDWSIKSYDNHSKNAVSVEKEFSIKNLPEGFDLQIVPSIDDIFGNPVLQKDYGEFVNANTENMFTKVLIPYREYFAAPVHSRKALLEKLMSAFSEASLLFSELVEQGKFISKEIAHRDCVADTVLHLILGALIRSCATRLYKRWLVEHSMVWKTADWSPVSAVRYGDFTMVIGMNAVETKIAEEALKGKTGLSRFFAKRQVKKQSVASVRSGTFQVVQKHKHLIDTSMEVGDPDDTKKTEPSSLDYSLVAIVPSLNETLGSVYLRSLFQREFVEKTLKEEELELFNALLAFYKKYDVMTNDELCESQEDMVKDALELCDKFKDKLPHSGETKERVKKQKFMFPSFFRAEETELYAKYHTTYEGELRSRKWK